MPLPASDPDEVMPKDCRQSPKACAKAQEIPANGGKHPVIRRWENRCPMTWWMTSNTSLITTKSSDSSTLKEQHRGRYRRESKEATGGVEDIPRHAVLHAVTLHWSNVRITIGRYCVGVVMPIFPVARGGLEACPPNVRLRARLAVQRSAAKRLHPRAWPHCRLADSVGV